VNTMPENALKALADHGDIPALMRADGGNCEEVLRQFDLEGINIHTLARKLQIDAAESFVNSWHELMRVLASRSATLGKAYYVFPREVRAGPKSTRERIS
jgi:transaldolase